MTSIRMIMTACIFAILAGVFVLLAWTFDLAMLTGNISEKVVMNPLTALLFVVAGLALCFLRRPHVSPRIRMLARLRASLPVVLNPDPLAGAKNLDIPLT